MHHEEARERLGAEAAVSERLGAGAGGGSGEMFVKGIEETVVDDQSLAIGGGVVVMG
jgi:hypothetical protein